MNSLSHYFNIIFYQTKVALQQESKRSYLGVLWWFFDPLMYIAIFLILTAAGLRFGGDAAGAAGFIVGISLFKLFGTVSGASASLLGNRGLMNQVSLPVWIFPIQAVLISFIKYLILVLVLLFYLWGNGAPFSIHYLSFPFIILVFLLVTTAFSIIFSAVVPFIPDLKFVLANMTLFFMFVSGTFIDIRSFSPEVQEIMFLNPIAIIIQSCKDVLLGYRWPMWNGLLITTVVSILVIVLGFRILHRLRHVYPKLTRG